MYYSSGNYEAFARPAKPEGIEDKSAYIVGTGLAGLSAACYLIRDAQMDGSRVHLFERDAEPGGEETAVAGDRQRQVPLPGQGG
ncbi:MAG: oleate hydratase, partial [Eggerthella sp.]|uniref:oleate hydratase n=1 Tax=Eggerthella sp. TaxID=1929886 RepID=UPI002904D8E0